MSMEIPLLNLMSWFEEMAQTPALTIIRRVVQGFFPLLPNTQVMELGKSKEEKLNIESLRAQLGERDFEGYVACQCEGYKHARSETGEGFYVAYLLGPTATHNVEKYKEKLEQVGYQTMDSEVYRNCFSTECDILKEYFARFMLEDNPDLEEIRRSFAIQAKPLWVYHSFTHEEAQKMGGAIYEKWTSGRTRVASKKLGKDKMEYQRAKLKALILTAQQFDAMAGEFIVVPDNEEYSLPFQVAFQFFERKDEFKTNGSPFSVTLG